MPCSPDGGRQNAPVNNNNDDVEGSQDSPTDASQMVAEEMLLEIIMTMNAVRIPSEYCLECMFCRVTRQVTRRVVAVEMILKLTIVTLYFMVKILMILMK